MTRWVPSRTFGVSTPTRLNDHVHLRIAWQCGIDERQEPERLLMPVSPVAVADCLAGSHVQSGKLFNWLSVPWKNIPQEIPGVKRPPEFRADHILSTSGVLLIGS